MWCVRAEHYGHYVLIYVIARASLISTTLAGWEKVAMTTGEPFLKVKLLTWSAPSSLKNQAERSGERRQALHFIFIFIGNLGMMMGHSFLHSGPCLSGLNPAIVLFGRSPETTTIQIDDCPDIDIRTNIQLVRILVVLFVQIKSSLFPIYSIYTVKKRV